MAERVSDVLWTMLAGAGVTRCYGIVGDALNPVIDGLRRNGQVEFIHVRNEEAGTFAAVADACLTGSPVAVCGTAGPRRGAPVPSSTAPNRRRGAPSGASPASRHA